MSLGPPSSNVGPMAPLASNGALMLVRGLAGGVLGGVVGYFVFRWLASQGFYGIIIPGALLGLGAGLASRARSRMLGVICAGAALLLSIYAEWSMFPFVKDGSFSFFVAHVQDLPPVKLIMMTLGVASAYWFGQGR